MTLNTIKDFLNTIQPDNSGITCPACGSILGIRNQGSTDMVLTENAKLILDGYIDIDRLFIEKIESTLAQRNITFEPWKESYPYSREVAFYEKKYNQSTDSKIELKVEGIYQGIFAEPVVKRILEDIDFFEWIEKFENFPRKESPDEEIYNKCRDILLGGLSPKSIIGPIMRLVKAQEAVVEWRNKINNDRSTNEKLDSFLEEVCPTILWYLNKLEEIESKTQKSLSVYQGIYEAKCKLALILGHKSQQPEYIGLDELKVSTNYPFSLPRRTIVSPFHLQKLLCSEVVLGKCDIGFNQKLLDELKKNYDSNKDKPDEDIIVKLVETFRQELFKFVNFACRNPSNKQFPSDEDDKNSTDLEQSDIEQLSKNEEEEEEKLPKTCGWYPKVEPTHSVILLGSPGTSKSTAMLTGLTTFYLKASALGVNTFLESPEDESRMRKFISDYKKGDLPKPTKTGAKTTIKLSVEFPEFDDSFQKTHFVFNDVAGEVVARSIKDEGSDSSVLRILKNAETIVFFFDLSIEPAVLMELSESNNDGFWKPIIEKYEEIIESRRKKKNKRSDADINQIQLLLKLIDNLRAQKNTNDLRKAGINFICVIPKADMFVSPDLTEDKRYFMTNFFTKLRSRSILVRPGSYTGDSFAGLHTQGGSGAFSDNNPQKNPSERVNTRLESQRKLCREINDLALESLEKIGDTLGDNAENAAKVGFSDTLRIQLIKALHHNFGKEKVYFLPISAQGQNTTDSNLGKKPTSKLSEYVFMLPIALSARVIEDNPPVDPDERDDKQRWKPAFMGR